MDDFGGDRFEGRVPDRRAWCAANHRPDSWCEVWLEYKARGVEVPPEVIGRAIVGDEQQLLHARAALGLRRQRSTDLEALRRALDYLENRAGPPTGTVSAEGDSASEARDPAEAARLIRLEIRQLEDNLAGAEFVESFIKGGWRLNEDAGLKDGKTTFFRDSAWNLYTALRPFFDEAWPADADKRNPLLLRQQMSRLLAPFWNEEAVDPRDGEPIWAAINRRSRP